MIKAISFNKEACDFSHARLHSGDAPWTNDDCHIALVCYEKSGDFCHRHIVADWLNQAGYDVKELEI